MTKDKSTALINKNRRRIALNEISTDVAIDKDSKREKKKALSGENLIDFGKRHSIYIQISTGLTHNEREVFVADVDVCESVSYKDVLRNIEDICCITKFPLPSCLQRHTTNDHMQLYWFFDRRVVVKKFLYNNKHIDDTRCGYNHSRYLYGLHTIAALMCGDRQFTGWQMKNVFYDNPNSAGEFESIWNTDDGWSDTEPKHIKTYSFERMCDVLQNMFKNYSIKDFTRLYELSNICGKYKDVYEFIAELDPDKTKYRLSKRDTKKLETAYDNKRNGCHYNGRNDCVRQSTLLYIRLCGKYADYDEGLDFVKEQLAEFMKTYHNDNPYTDSELLRDYQSTYIWAVKTYDESKAKKMYTEQQCKNSVEHRTYKKMFSEIRMLNFIETNPKYIRNTLSTNKVIAELLGVTAAQVSNYKKELGITKTTIVLKRKNKKPIIDKFVDYFSYVDSLGRTYYNMCMDGCFKSSKTKRYKYKNEDDWLKRIRSVYDKDEIAAFLKNNKVPNVNNGENIQTEWERHI